MKQFILIVCLISLFFSFTNVVPLSVLASTLLVFVPLIVINKSKVNKVFFSLLLLLTYFSINTICYYPSSFIEWEFYRRDGNVFVSYAPLLVLSLLQLDIDLRKIFQWFIYISTFINGLFLTIYFYTGNTILFAEEGIYHLLFEAHNAAGGFLMILASISLGKYLDSKKKTDLLIFIINFIGLYETYSRGSLLAFIVAIFLYYIFKCGYEKSFIYVFILFQSIVYGWLYNNAADGFLNETLFTVDFIESDFTERGGTIINRGFYLWPRAIYLFLQSPIFGTGFGSFNDLPYTFEGFFIFFKNVVSSGNIAYSDFHAHNTFLHVLGETGVVGLGLLIYFLSICNDFLKKIPDKMIFSGLYIAFWSSIFSAATEHRLFTPSQMSPFMILLGLAVAKYNWKYK